MNINKITNFNNRNNAVHSNTACQSRVNFGAVIYDYELSKVFATPALAEPFVKAILRLQEIPINLKELLNYDSLSALEKTICDEYFKLIGDKEVLNHTVRLKPVFEYCDGKPKRSGIKLFASLPAWRNDSYDAVKNGLKIDNKSSFGFIDAHTRQVSTGPYYQRQEEVPREYEVYPAGKIWCFSDIGAYLPTMNGIKEMLKITLMKRIDDIRKSMEALDASTLEIYTEKARIDAFNYLQSLISGGSQSVKEASSVDEVRLMAASYDILQDAVKKNSSIDYIMKQILSRAGVDVTDKDAYSFRIKGANNIHSIFKRLITRMKIMPSLYKDLEEHNFLSAKDYCYDIFGAKVNAKSDDEIDKIFDELMKAINSGVFKPIQVINYRGKGIRPIFRESQMRRMSFLTNDMGLKTKYADKEHVSNSGYTSVNIRAKVDGEPLELQIRTKAIDLLTNLTHYSYDVFLGKDILSSYTTEEQKILKPLIDELIKIKNNKALRAKYNQYTQQCYAAARGDLWDFPKIEEFDLPQIVSIESMTQISNMLGH